MLAAQYLSICVYFLHLSFKHPLDILGKKTKQNILLFTLVSEVGRAAINIISLVFETTLHFVSECVS